MFKPGVIEDRIQEFRKASFEEGRRGDALSKAAVRDASMKAFQARQNQIV